MTPDMPLASLGHRLGLSSIPPEWPALWERFHHAPPNPGFSLAPEALADTVGFCRFPEEVTHVLLEAAAEVRGDPGLTAMTRFLFGLYFADPPPSHPSLATWPFVSQILKPPASLLPALVLLAGVPQVRRDHAHRGIPEAVTQATLSDLDVWMRTFHRQNGHWGLTNLGWLSNHWSGILFRLGRLQFKHGRFPSVVRAFRQKATGRVQAFAEPGEIRYRQDGLADGTQDTLDPQAWAATLSVTETAITGHPVDPAGRVGVQPITLPTAEWEPALAPGDPMLDIHIPEGGPMDFDACGQSLQQAPAFFATHFPELPRPVTFYCGTWFFDSQLQGILPPTSNIIRFQREFYLYPMRSTDKETFRRVFGGVPADLRTAPRDTSLRRAILDFTLAGNHLRCASGFRLVSAPPWGTAPYHPLPAESR